MGSKVKHRWHIRDNYLAGITAGQWWRLIQENRYRLDMTYWHRAAFITVASLRNSFFYQREEARFGREIARTEIQPPLFVLGHWRTGTTLLHNLISRDRRFAYPNSYEVVHPGSFLSKEDQAAPQWAAMLRDRTRPMDNVLYDLDLPQEDEFVLALACRKSPTLALNFPRTGLRYLRYLTFEGVPREEIEEWKRAFRWFLKKLTLRYRRPLVLKSPPHTARIRLLLETFPEARFVHLHREPYTVFQSWLHTNDATGWYLYLQEADREHADLVSLKMGQLLYHAYFDQRHLIPEGRLVDIAYEDLEARPVEVVEEIYQKLGLPDFEVFRPTLQAYVDSLGGYKKNRFSELAPEERAKVAESWRRCFEVWGYPI